MGFWGNFFKGFAKVAASGLSAGALDEAVRAAKEEVDGLDGATADERAAMKTGVDLLRQRVQQFVDEQVEDL